MKRSNSSLRKLTGLTASVGLPALIIIATLGLAGCNQSAPPSSPSAAASPTPGPSATPAPASVTPNSFADVTAQLDPGGDFYVYLSTADWLSRLAQTVDSLRQIATASAPQANAYFDLLEDVIKKSGIQQMSGVGASTLHYSQDLYRHKVFVHHYPADGAGLIWSLYGTAPHAMPEVNFLPATTAIGGVTDFDLAAMINFLRQEMAASSDPQIQQAAAQWETQFNGLTGLKLDDVLASLNGKFGMIITLDSSNTITVPTTTGGSQTVPYPRAAILLAVKNDLIFKQVDKMMSSTPGLEKVDEPGLSMRTMQVPAVPFMQIRATLAQWNGYLVLATDDKLVRDLDATLKGGPGVKSTPEYTLMSPGLPDQMNSFFICTDAFAKLQQRFAAQGSMNSAQTAIMQKFQQTGHFISESEVLPNGLLTTTHSSIGAKQLLTPLVAVPAVFAGAAAAGLFSSVYHPNSGAYTPPSTYSSPAMPGSGAPAFPPANPGTSP
jgi:hypothetical protein